MFVNKRLGHIEKKWETGPYGRTGYLNFPLNIGPNVKKKQRTNIFSCYMRVHSVRFFKNRVELIFFFFLKFISNTAAAYGMV